MGDSLTVKLPYFSVRIERELVHKVCFPGVQNGIPVLGPFRDIVEPATKQLSLGPSRDGQQQRAVA